MKILLVTFLYDPTIGGGAAAAVQMLARGLAERGHSVTVLTTARVQGIQTSRDGDVKILSFYPPNLYWVYEKDNQPAWKKGLWQIVDTWNPLVFRIARDLFLQETPDVVHVHKLRGLSPAVWSAAASAGIKKIVHTCHDYEILSPEGTFMGRVGRLAREQNLVMRPYQNLRRGFSRLVNEATAPSQFVLKTHLDMNFFPRAKTRIIPNSHGLDANEIQQNISESSKFPKKDLARHFLFLGRLDKAKGIDLLCQAFLQAAGQKQDLLLKIAGWGPLETSLREKYKHQSNIVFTGPVFGTQKAEIFRNSDMLVAPSIVPETFGISIAEAYSYGLPVIASRIGAFPEIVRDGETGFLVEPGSVADLASALVKAGEAHSLTEAMYGNCFEEAQKYTTEKMIDGYLDVYGERP